MPILVHITNRPISQLTIVNDAAGCCFWTISDETEKLIQIRVGLVDENVPFHATASRFTDMRMRGM